MSLRMGLGPWVACSALFLVAQTASAQTKVAVVNLQQAVFESAEIKKADAEMQARYRPRQQEIEKITADLTAVQQKLQAGQGKLSEQAAAELQAQGQKLQRDLQRRQEDLQADAERDRNEVLSKSSQKMQEIVKKVAEGKGFDLVVDTSTTLYFKEPMDITKDVIVAYDQAYPVAAPAAPAAPAKPTGK
ncbi:MAG: OmpH family outer membrane protein [Acidobacteriia bacterium]|nr:OmpH family outer membrane protein [Terriglobia bacterium]